MQKIIQDGNRGPSLRGLFRADSVSSVSGLAGIQGAIGRSEVISAILAEDPMSGFAKFDSSIEIMKNLKKCEENISTLKNGSEKIRASLKRVMSQNWNLWKSIMRLKTMNETVRKDWSVWKSQSSLYEQELAGKSPFLRTSSSYWPDKKKETNMF